MQFSQIFLVDKTRPVTSYWLLCAQCGLHPGQVSVLEQLEPQPQAPDNPPSFGQIVYRLDTIEAGLVRGLFAFVLFAF